MKTAEKNEKTTTINSFLQYSDFFGTIYSFYIERKPKLYTELGGILSIFSILLCIIVFFFFSLDDIKRLTPTLTMSSLQPSKLRKIKFGEEKIWLPWRIAGNNNHFVNHSSLIFPIIYYYPSINNAKRDGGFEFNTIILNYSLCSETSMKNMTNVYSIDVPLNELYCIEMDDLEIGGSWTDEFLNYIQFDLYLCKNGINYDENNENCTKYENLRSIYGSLSLSLFYPVVQIQSTNIENPVKVIYREYFYQFSKFSNKLDRIYLEENVFIDDLGWITKMKNKNSYWGFSYINSDSYTTGNTKDIMDEGSTSRLYSFNIYLEPTINTYNRSFKKIYTILAEAAPVVFVLFIIFKSIANIFKSTSSNKKITELLFENLTEKKNTNEKKFIKKIFKREGRLSVQNNNIINNNSLENNGKINDLLFNERSITPLHIENNFKDKSINIFQKNKNTNQEIFNNCQDSPSPYVSSKFFPNSSSLKPNYNNKVDNKKKEPAKIVSFLNQYCKQTPKRNSSSYNNSIQPRKKFISKPLFPYRYYFCSIFIKNINISKNNLCFDKKFAKIYTFLCQLLDISSYLVLQKEFNILKHTFVDKKKMKYIEKDRKINVNAHAFIRKIDDCINDNNFKIFE